MADHYRIIQIRAPLEEALTVLPVESKRTSSICYWVACLLLSFTSRKRREPGECVCSKQTQQTTRPSDVFLGRHSPHAKIDRRHRDADALKREKTDHKTTYRQFQEELESPNSRLKTPEAETQISATKEASNPNVKNW
jgi:hypothetical protein